jgi:putative ABC transport system substrate-binding protein
MQRRDFIVGIAAVLSFRAKAQSGLPVVALVHGGSTSPENAAAFGKGLSESGYVDGQNVLIEYHWLEGRYDRLPPLMADLVNRRVAVIATPGSVNASSAAKAATSTIPIVFGVAEDPVRLGLVASIARPGGNATGFNFFNTEVDAKRLGLLHELVPNAKRVAILVNPSNPRTAEQTTQSVEQAARLVGMQTTVHNASTNCEIDAAFAAFMRNHPDALFVAPDGYFFSRNVQFATLAAREKIPAAHPGREFVSVGGLMSYGTNTLEMFRQVGSYAGKVLLGTKPADLPVLQATKFEFVISQQTARSLDLSVPETLLATADEVIE